MARCGLRNNGNDCFINSTLQCLAVSPFIRNFINRYSAEDTKLIEIINKFSLGKFKADDIQVECARLLKTKNDLGKDELKILTHLTKHTSDIFIYISFKEIIRNLNEKKAQIISNSMFLSVIRELSEDTGFEHLFNGEQNDPHEFIVYLLDRLHNSKSSSVSIDLPENIAHLDEYYKLYLTHFKARYENDYSYFVKNLYFYILNCIECSKCKNKTYDVCPNDILCVSIPQISLVSDITLDDCLNEMFKVDAIGYKCEQCGNREDNRMEKKILSKPKTLIIKIKRYASSTIGNRLVKVNKMIHYPEELDIQNHLCSDKINNYELYGIINHTGSLNGGHYFSYVKSINSKGEFTDQWVSCNDSSVRNISKEDAMTSNNAYMLYYNLIE